MKGSSSSRHITAAYFIPNKYPHIAHTPQPNVSRWEIGDHRLTQVVDLLAYRRERWDEAGALDIDYKTLDVQHLGSIYEGLLELQPHITTEPLVETLEDSKPVFKAISQIPTPRPIRGQPPRTVNTSEVNLVSNRGGRQRRRAVTTRLNTSSATSSKIP